MKTAIAIIYFAYFGFCWPVYLGRRARGTVAFAAMVAPWVAFWMGYFAK